MHKKTIPTNIKQCIEPDEVTENLWKWADIMKKIGVVSAIITGFFTIFLSFTIILNFRLNFGLGMLCLAMVALIIALAYLMWFIPSLLVNAIGNIVYNTHISANTALLKRNRAKDITDELNSENSYEDGYEPIFKNITVEQEPIFRNTTVESERVKPVVATPSENEWQCSNCGKIHNKYVGTCGCGERKPY